MAGCTRADRRLVGCTRHTPEHGPGTGDPAGRKRPQPRRAGTAGLLILAGHRQNQNHTASADVLGVPPASPGVGLSTPSPHEAALHCGLSVAIPHAWK